MAVILDTNGLSAMADRGPEAAPLPQQAGVAGNCAGRTCRVLSVDESTAAVYADTHGEFKRVSRPIPGNDLWIAARQHSLPLLSRDRHFDLVTGA